MKVLQVFLFFYLSAIAVSSVDWDRTMGDEMNRLNPGPTNLIYDAGDSFIVDTHWFSPNELIVEMQQKTAYGIKHVLHQKPVEASTYLRNLFQQFKKCGGGMDNSYYDAMASFIIANVDDFDRLLLRSDSGLIKVTTNTKEAKDGKSFKEVFRVFTMFQC